MKYIMLFVMFAVFSSIFDWIIRKTDIHNKLFNNPRIRKHIKIILIILFLVFVFYVEYMKTVLRHMHGFDSYVSIIVGAFLSSVYLNFIPLIFKKDKK